MKTIEIKAEVGQTLYCIVAKQQRMNIHNNIWDYLLDIPQTRKVQCINITKYGTAYQFKNETYHEDSFGIIIFDNYEDACLAIKSKKIHN